MRIFGRRKHFRSRCRWGSWLGIAVLLQAAPLAGSTVPEAIRFAVGDRLAYAFEYRGRVHTQIEGPWRDQVSPREMQLSVSLRLHLRVEATDSNGSTRVRLTVDTARATVQGNGYDPLASALEASYRALEGKSLAFRINPWDGWQSEPGPELQPAGPLPVGLLQWVGSLFTLSGTVTARTKPGQKWVRVVPVEGAPLAGLRWRLESKVEAVAPCAGPIGRVTPAERCAEIRTHLESLSGSGRADSTAPELLRQGVHTAGHWISRGESLSEVALSRGLLESSTATEQQDIDLTFSHPGTTTTLRYRVRTEGQAQLWLIALEPAAH